MNDDYETKTIVLKHNLSEDEVHKIIEKKKTSLFKKFLSKPKPEEVTLDSLELFYEAILRVSGKYDADFFRKAIHPIEVDYNVSEVVLGEGIFPIRTKSSIQKAFSGKHAKNKIDLKLEEHVYIENEGSMYFDSNGIEINFPFKIDSKITENYPKKILTAYASHVKKPEITTKVALTKLGEKLQRQLEPDVRDLNDEFLISDVSEIYVPVFEARLVGPKKKVAIMRIDAVRKKVL